MPNWCSSSYCISGPKKAVEDAKKFIEDALKAAPNKDASSPESWLGQIVIACGLDPDKVSCRGWIEAIEGVEEIRVGLKDISYFYLYSEDAWGPMPEVFLLMIEKKFSGKGLELCYTAEEPGCGLYCNTDSSGMFFPEKWIVEDYDSFHEYFESDEELIEFINNEFELSCKTIADVLDFANSANGDSLHLCLNQFTAS